MATHSSIFAGQTLIGTPDGDELRGGNGDDQLIGNDGNDFLRGGGGNDVLLGGRGRDVLNGGNGNDILYGGRDDDYLIGGQGNDYLSGDRGSDILDGGLGADVYAFNVAAGWLGDGVDRVLNFTIGEDRLAIVGGDKDLVSFAAGSGTSARMFYDGVQVATIFGVTAEDLQENVGLLFT